MVLHMNDLSTFDELLREVRRSYEEAKRQASLAEIASNLKRIEEVGPLIRYERKEQNLTLNDLCDLSGVAYATLSKLEKGNSSVRLDILNKVLNALGMKLWVG